MSRAHHKLPVILWALLALVTVSIVDAAEWKEDDAVAGIFKNAGVKGTFVLFDVSAKRFIVYNKERAVERFVPASTFKIPNSLIGLATGAVKSVDEILPYRGHPKSFSKAWEKNMGLREAIAVSNVPIYQELARRIGLERMRDNLSRINYGNTEVGSSVDTFWLNGPLRISAVEQAEFLAKLAQGSLSFPEDTQRSVREICLLDKGSNWKLYGKTGWENAPDPGTGWWVGWVEKDGRIYAFALNIDIIAASDAGKRIELGKASLRALGVI